MALMISVESCGEIFSQSRELGVLREYIVESCQNPHRILGLKSEDSSDTSRVEAKYDLGFGMIAIEQSYALGGIPRLESHRKYIDIQLCVKGREYIIFTDNAVLDTPYDESKDVAFYKPCEEVSRLFMKPKSIAILLPYDIHAGGIAVNPSDRFIYKSVIKIPREMMRF